MEKLFIERCAADNEYFHKDFHCALSVAIEYLQTRFGGDAVRRYLRQFASSFYAPLTRAIIERGLAALKEHLERIYAIEGGQIDIKCSEDELTLHVLSCPAITHIRVNGYTPPETFRETSKTVYQTICEGTPFQAEMLDYDSDTGRSTVRFSRRQK